MSNEETLPRGKSKRRHFSKNTRTWLLFEKLFLDADPSAYPIVLGPYTKGQALNLAIGLNTCHVQHKEETGMPESTMLYSAKPKEQEDKTWQVEISTNYTRTGKLRPSRQDKGQGHWMDSLLGQKKLGKVEKPAQSDTQEDLLSKFYKE